MFSLTSMREIMWRQRGHTNRSVVVVNVLVAPLLVPPQLPHQLRLYRLLHLQRQPLRLARPQLTRRLIHLNPPYPYGFNLQMGLDFQLASTLHIPSVTSMRSSSVLPQTQLTDHGCSLPPSRTRSTLIKVQFLERSQSSRKAELQSRSGLSLVLPCHACLP